MVLFLQLSLSSCVVRKLVQLLIYSPGRLLYVITLESENGIGVAKL